jgi:LRV protein FeS4 cluster
MNGAENPVTQPIADCSLCPFRGKTLLMGRCMPGDTCVFIESGRQIDRFFRMNPNYAAHYLQDKFWERRAIAVRYAPVKLIYNMLNDEDEIVRRAVAMRLPPADLHLLIDDPHRDVRMSVAERIDLQKLEYLADDNDYIVRLAVAKRLAPGRLFRFIKDCDLQIRKCVAERLPEVSLGLMINDEAAEVRRIIAERMSADAVECFINDNDWLVRYTAALKVEQQALYVLINDPEPDIREVVRQRLNITSPGKIDHD